MSLWIVICRDSSPPTLGGYTLATRRVFTSQEAAEQYASTVASSRMPMVVDGDFSRLRLPVAGDV